jgi:outer membrane receptor protein involved in Fe transport
VVWAERAFEGRTKSCSLRYKGTNCSRVQRILLITVLLVAEAYHLQGQDTLPLWSTLPSDLIERADSIGLAERGTASVAGTQGQDLRETPSSTVVLTSRDILASGARDLFEALMLLPGFYPGVGYDDAVGPSVRGLWALEGKFLFMLNGMQLNESAHGIFGLGGRIDLADVAYIEVIKGPSSLLYGGFATLGVLNVVTHTSRTRPGTHLQVGASTTAYAPIRQQLALSGNHVVGSSVEVMYSAQSQFGLRGDRVYELPDGRWLSARDSTAFASNTFMAQLKGRRFLGQVLSSHYQYTVRNSSAHILSRNNSVGLEYELHQNADLRITTRTDLRRMEPWTRIYEDNTELVDDNTTDDRVAQTVLANATLRPWLNTRAGMGAILDRVTHISGSEDIAEHGHNSLLATNFWGYGEWEASGLWGNLTAGARMEYAGALASWHLGNRFAYTLVRERVHFKALVGGAYRLPTLHTIDEGQELEEPEEEEAPDAEEAHGPHAEVDLEAERFNSQEVEVGFRLGKGTDVTLNVFNGRLAHGLVAAVVEQSHPDRFLNGPELGTAGFEIQARVPFKGGFFSGSISTYRATVGAAEAHEATPRLVIRGRASHALTKQLHLGAVVLWNSASHSTIELEQEGNEDRYDQKLPQALSLDLNSRYALGRKNACELLVYLRNATDSGRLLANPAFSGQAPVPVLGRELGLQLNLRIAE